MDYQTYKPSEELETLIKCYWTLEGEQDALTRQRILPDGCMEMIVHYGDLYRQYLDDDRAIIQPRSFVFGQITRPLFIEPTGQTGIFGIRFLPDGFSPFTDLSVLDMNDQATCISDIFGSESKDFETSILQAVTTEARIAIAESFLLTKLISLESVDRLVKSSVELIVNLNGQLAISELAKKVIISQRQLERRFSSIIGLSPKQLCRIIRLQAILKMLMKEERSNLTTISYQANYYDQSHFVREFREFTGLSPKQFYAEDLQLASIFSK